MGIRPVTTLPDAGQVKKEIDGISISELDIDSLRYVLKGAKSVQARLSSISIQDRMDVFEEMGRIWADGFGGKEQLQFARDLANSSGYSERLMGIELSFVREMFSRDNIYRNLRHSFIGGVEGLHGFIEMEDGELYRYMPSGPVFIISSGNSLIPPLIPTTLSLVTGNVTILKPSLSNYVGVAAAYGMLDRVDSEASRAIKDALTISYFTHDSDSLRYLLKEASLGVVNFWGAEPARSQVGMAVMGNPNHPSYLVNGPFTGMAIIDAAHVDDGTASALATNMILYDQQLCSSPTQAVFIGSIEGANDLASMVAVHLDALGDQMPMKQKEGHIFALNNARRALMFKGSKILQSKASENPWTLVISKGSSRLDDVMVSMPEFNIFNRRRFLEIIVLDDIGGVADFIEAVPKRPSYMGIDGVQSIGLAVTDENQEYLSEHLPHTGVYRITCLGDMFMRSALEPYDGNNIASIFTYTLYRRSRSLPCDVVR